jgi:spore coat protein U-like protein
MKKIAVWFLAVGFVLTMSGKSMAADTANVTVSATVLDSCLFTSAGDLAFGAIDPSVAGPYLPVVTQVNVQCGVGTAFTITDDGGNNGPAGGPYAMDNGLGNLLVYSFTYTNAGAGLGFGSNVSLGINGSVTQAAAQAVPADVYADTVQLSILP